MTAVAADQIAETMQNLKETAEAALSSESADQLSDLERYVNEVEAYVRESQQAMWADQAGAAIRNLEKGAPITEADKEAIRTFLVCDADRYLAHENNYADWKHEFKRLMNDLVRRANMVDRNSIGDLRGVLKDAIRLVPDIRNYLEELKRLEQFEQALGSLDDSSRAMLARLMKEQLSSPNR